MAMPIEAAAFSSFRLSLNPRPACRRSRPVTDFEKAEFAPGDCGVNEYSDEGAEGSTACEFDDADDNGRNFSPCLCFCRDRK